MYSRLWALVVVARRVVVALRVRPAVVHLRGHDDGVERRAERGDGRVDRALARNAARAQGDDESCAARPQKK